MCLYYGRVVDHTILPALSALASEQSEATTKHMHKIRQLVDYLARHPDDTVRFHALDMVLSIHLDASYLLEPKAKNRLAGFYCLGSVPQKGKNIKMNGNIFVACGVLRIVVCSTAEAELGALFLNIKEGKILCIVPIELGHKQPPTLVHCDNSTATGITNETVNKTKIMVGGNAILLGNWAGCKW